MPLPPPPPPPPTSARIVAVGQQQVVDPATGINALLADIRNGPRLRAVPKPKEKNIFIKNDQNNNNDNSENDVINGLHVENENAKKNPLKSELQAELTDTLKRRQNYKEDDKAGVRTFDPNILNTHVPQPTGLKIGHAGPNFKIQSMKTSSLEAPRKSDEVMSPKIGVRKVEMLEAKKVLEVKVMKSPEIVDPESNGPSIVEAKKILEARIMKELKTPEMKPKSNGWKKEENQTSKPPLPMSSKEKSPPPPPSVSMKETAKGLVRITSFEKTPKPILNFHEPTFEIQPEGIKPELLSPKSEVMFQIGSAKAEIVQKSNSELRDEIDRPDPTIEFDIKRLVSSVTQKDDVMPNSGVRKMIQRLNSEERSGTLPRAAKTNDVKTNSLKRDVNGAGPLKIGHPKANFTIQKMTSPPLRKAPSPAPMRSPSPQSPIRSPVLKSLSPEPKVPKAVLKSLSPETIRKPTASPPVPKIVLKNLSPETIRKPMVSPEPVPPPRSPIRKARSPPPTPTRMSSLQQRSPSPLSPTPEKQTSTLFRTQATVNPVVVPASPPFINGKSSPDIVKKIAVTNTKSVPSKKRPAPKPPLTAQLSSPTSPLSPNQSTLFSTYTQSLSQQKTELNDSGIDVNYEAKQQVSFAKDLANAPNNHKEIVKTSATLTKADDVLFDGVNLRQIKIDINDRNSVRVMPK